MPLENNPRKLTIAQVIDVYEHATNGAGISTQRFTDLLRKDDHKVLIIATGKEAPDKIILNEYYPPVPYLKKVMQRMKFVFALPDKKILQETFSKVDIVHNQLPLYLGIKAIDIAKNMNKPIISTFHVQGEQLMFNGGLKHKFWTKLAYKIFLRYIYNKSDIVICPSQFAENEIKRYGLKTPTVVISNGVPKEFKVMDVPKKYPGKFTILTAGRNAAEKRQELLIRAVAASPYKDQIQLIVLGVGHLRNHLERLSKELLGGRVEFQFVPTNEVISYYNSADLYVHAAEVEVECMTAIEAMACGLPLLIADSELSATKQFALNDKHLFKTLEELTQKINYWFTHQDELKKKKEEHVHAAQQYSIENSYQKLLDTYYKVLEMHGEKKKQPALELQES